MSERGQEDAASPHEQGETPETDALHDLVLLPADNETHISNLETLCRSLERRLREAVAELKRARPELKEKQ